MAETEFKYDVFISYSHKDEKWLRGVLLPTLEKQGLKVCIDYRDFIAGKPAIINMADASETSRHTLLVLTPRWVESEWTLYEGILSRTDDPAGLQRRTIPLLLEKCTPPKFISMLTWVDFTNEKREKEAWQNLFKSLDKKIDKVKVVKTKADSTKDESRSESGGVHVGKGVKESVIVVGDGNTIVVGKTDVPAPAPSKPDISTPAPGSRDTWHLAHPYPMPPNFTGRAAELKMLDDWLTDDKDRLFILRALGGFGKSALAWQWINTHVDPAEWRQLVWWSFYEGDSSFEHFIEETLKYLKLEVPQGGRPQVDELLKAMQGGKILLIMDGFERALRAYSSMNAAYQGDEELKREGGECDCVNINAEHFLKSVCALPSIKGKVLMTTRLTPRAVELHGSLLQGCREDTLRTLDKVDALSFFRAQGIQGTRAEIEAVCESYGCHPLSLRLLAGLILNDLQAPGDISVVRQLDISNDIIQNKHHVLEHSYNSLSPDQQKLLSNIACFRSSMPYEALKAIFANSAAIRDLLSRGLLSQDKVKNKFDLHPIVRRYAYERLTAPDRTAAHARLRDYFAAVDAPAKPQNFDDLSPIIELYNHTVRAGELEKACELLYNRLMEPIYYQFGAYHIAIELLVELFPDGDDKPPHLNDQAWTVGTLSSAYAMCGQPIRSVKLGTLALKLVEKERDKTNIPIALVNLGRRQMAIGALAESAANHNRMIQICKETQEINLEGTGHYELGRVLSYIGKQDEANNELNMAEQIKKDKRHIQALTITSSYRALYFLLMARANPQTKISNLKSSIASASHALELAESGDPNIGGAILPSDLVRSRWLLGAAYRANGVSTGSTTEILKAEENLSKAISMCRQINLVEMEADILLDLARLRYAQSDFKDAQEKASEALMITERSGYVLQGADVNLFLAELALAGITNGELGIREAGKMAARRHAEDALKLATCDGPPYYYKVAYEEAEKFLEKLK